MVLVGIAVSIAGLSSVKGNTTNDGHWRPSRLAAHAAFLARAAVRRKSLDRRAARLARDAGSLHAAFGTRVTCDPRATRALPHGRTLRNPEGGSPHERHLPRGRVH